MKLFSNSHRFGMLAATIAISCAAQGCTPKKESLETKVVKNAEVIASSDDLSRIANDNVQWNGSYIGVVPELRGPAIKVLKQIAEEHQAGRHETRDKLVSLMEDPDRFIVAHVLLTKSLFEKKYSIDGSHWNGLEVRIPSNGVAQIDPRQRADLVVKWKSEADSPRK
jgi:hypothetical protein